MTRITPRAAAPALMCTAVPPAKSITPSSKAQPPAPQTQWATGKYTIVTHRVMNSAQAENFTRSASAPLIRAGVMMANISWKTRKTKTGIVYPSHSSVRPMLLRPTQSEFQPMSEPESVPKAREKP
jgi:hypothetical protein